MLYEELHGKQRSVRKILPPGAYSLGEMRTQEDDFYLFYSLLYLPNLE